MKILYAAAMYDYCRKEWGYSYEHYGFYQPLVEMGHEVEYVPIDDANIANEVLVRNSYDHDLMLSCIFYDRIKTETLDHVRSYIPTVNWFTDDQWYWNSYSKKWCSHFEWSITTAGIGPELYRGVGYDNVIKSQWGAPSSCKLLNLERVQDVVFVGRPHNNRGAMIHELLKARIDVKVYGVGWDAGWSYGKISQDEMVRVYNTAKIALNFCESAMWGGYYQIKGRHYEPQGCGAMLLTDVPGPEWKEEYDKDYEYGKEIGVFDGSVDLIDKIRYYLSHDSEREAIAKAGYERTMRDHTYDKRFKAIFKEMGL